MTSHERYVDFVMHFVMTRGLCIIITLGRNSRILIIETNTQASINWSTWFSFQCGLNHPVLENTPTSNLSQKCLNANIAEHCRSFGILVVESLEIDSLGATRQAAQREERTGTRFHQMSRAHCFLRWRAAVIKRRTV